MNKLFTLFFILVISFYSSLVLAERGYLATSYCGIKDVYGYGYGRSQDIALSSAIEDCIADGGVPKCCANKTEVINIYKAYAHCSVTNKYGTGFGRNLSIAIDNAVDKCVSNGGIPDCCRNGISI